MKRLSHFLLFYKTGQFLASFLTFLPRLSGPACSLLVCFTVQAINQVAPAQEILNPATTGPYGAAYPYGYYSELPPNPPEPGTSGNSTNSANANSTAGSLNDSQTPQADNNSGYQSQTESANTKPPEAMPEPKPEAKASGGESDEKLNPEQKALLEAAAKKIEKIEKEEKREKPETETEKPAAEKKGLLEEMAASRKKQGNEKDEQEPSRQTPEVLPESPAHTVLKEMKQGLYAKALVDLENLKRLNPQAYELDYLSAINHIMLKQPAQARVYYEKILHSQAPDALKQLAQTGLKKIHSSSKH